MSVGTDPAKYSMKVICNMAHLRAGVWTSCKCGHPTKQNWFLYKWNEGPPLQTNLDPRFKVNSIRIGSVKDQKGFGRHSERFEEFRALEFSARIQRALRSSVQI